ncbi:Lrp/AsnC ligand binding domain-containing protein [Glycomyces sp. NRRL B-16210]|uniref:Lrp/AsnC ligand binding domain-containing protein n=1 Tax=Glycomyces sp. NRRL B-16210 TaxID=1463821 RepID=UPI0004C1D242|nr:Lrp/AsnC ligand binding domain-containing protein [Glycomyces sp. NRRL B-16210]
MVQAYMLVQTEVGRADQVAKAVSEIEGVVRVDTVTGPYDVVVLTEAASVDLLGTAVVGRVQRVAGITRTLTCSILKI